MLERVRRTLRKAEAEARKREADPILAGEDLTSEPDELASKLAGLQDLLAARRQSLTKAEEVAQATDTFLQHPEKALQAWLRAVRGLVGG